MPKKEIITIKTNSHYDPLKELIRDHEIENTKSQAQKNHEILLNILETLEKMTDMMKDIHLNNVRLYQELKKNDEAKKEGWFY